MSSLALGETSVTTCFGCDVTCCFVEGKPVLVPCIWFTLSRPFLVSIWFVSHCCLHPHCSLLLGNDMRHLFERKATKRDKMQLLESLRVKYVGPVGNLSMQVDPDMIENFEQTVPCVNLVRISIVAFTHIAHCYWETR
jgi:hypothetical protein